MSGSVKERGADGAQTLADALAGQVAVLQTAGDQLPT
jgi:hypothetical protein